MKLTLLLAFLALSASAQQPAAGPANITIDTTSARAVLAAVRNPALTREQALAIAAMPGNQGLVQKENSYGRHATTQSLADALFAVAHDETPSADFRFRFERLKPRAEVLTALLDRIVANPSTFRDWVITRVNTFSPPDSKLAITGYLIAGGTSGGFAFGKAEFYLNLNYFDEFETAKVVMAHELYHAVQGAYEVEPKDWWAEKGAESGPNAVLAKQCETNFELFEALYEEGSASYVGDVLQLKGAPGPGATKLLSDFQDGLSRLDHSITLLELSITGLNAPKPVPYDEVYAAGFYVPEVLYKIGYVMSKDIATDEGTQALTAALKHPGYAFAAQYLTLPKYGKDEDHPALDPNTVAAIQRLQAGCPIPAKAK